jgi:hypothetical protein
MKKIILLLTLAALICPLCAQTPAEEMGFYKKEAQSAAKKLLSAVRDGLTLWGGKIYALAVRAD